MLANRNYCAPNYVARLFMRQMVEGDRLIGFDWTPTPIHQFNWSFHLNLCTEESSRGGVVMQQGSAANALTRKHTQGADANEVVAETTQQIDWRLDSVLSFLHTASITHAPI